MGERDKETIAKGKEVQLVIFRLSNEEFGVDISQVKEIIRMQNITPMPRTPEFVKGVINLRGQIIAVIDLAKRFGLGEKTSTEKSRVIVTEIMGENVGIIVDEVPEVLRIPEDNIEPTPEMIESRIHADFIKGVGKFEKRLIIFLNLDNVLGQQELAQIKEL